MNKEEEIYFHAGELFKKLGVRSVSMDDIARELKVSKKTLYQYVSNKSELLEKAFQVHVEMDNEFYQNLSKKSGLNAIDVLLEVSDMVIQKQKELNPSFLFDVQKYYPEVFLKFWNINKEIIRKRILANMERGISEGLYRSDLNINLIVDLYIEKITKMGDLHDTLCEHYSFEEIFKTSFENHIRAIANEKGIKYYEDKRKINEC